jgi:adenine-specific DNA-methyltransferase
MATRGKRTKNSSDPAPAKSYTHKDQTALMRPDVGTQAQFKKRKEPVRYAYDHPIPLLQWDGDNPAREQGEALIREILEAGSLDSAKAAAEKLKRMSQPFLEWTGKKERASFDVPTLPLFVHERLSTKAIIETLQGHKRDKQMSLDLFGDPEHSITDQVLKAYEHQDRWVNRMILGDSQVVMNSLLQYEGMAGKVQMIYMDPPFGVKFGSNFQPFVRRRDVTHGSDEDMTREPEMVQAYRDTWERGTHSYLGYMRDRLELSHRLLASRGSIFVQINDTHLHHVRELLDEVFGADNFAAIITYAKTTSTTGDDLSTVNDFIVWYFRDHTAKPKMTNLFKLKRPGETGGTGYTKVKLSDGTIQPLSEFDELPIGARICTTDNLTSTKPPGDFPVEFAGKVWRPLKGYWKTGPDGMKKLIAAGRVAAGDETLS